MGETFVGEFFRWVAKFFPRLRICEVTYGGVKFKRGKKIKEIKPGLFVYWPLVTSIQLIPTKHHSIDLPAQSLTTRSRLADDEQEDDEGEQSCCVGVSTVVVLTIPDVVKALTETHDIDGLITEVGGSATVKAVTTRSFNTCLEELTKEVEHEITLEARKLLRRYGVHVERAYITDFSMSKTFRHMGDGPGVIEDDEEE
jgi:regulator of protease activity HflC (stomatin/prohibitin superfamily)